MRFADGIVLGVLEGSTGFVLVNPPAAYTLNEDEQIILLRPTNMTQVCVALNAFSQLIICWTG